MLRASWRRLPLRLCGLLWLAAARAPVDEDLHLLRQAVEGGKAGRWRRLQTAASDGLPDFTTGGEAAVVAVSDVLAGALDITMRIPSTDIAETVAPLTDCLVRMLGRDVDFTSVSGRAIDANAHNVTLLYLVLLPPDAATEEVTGITTLMSNWDGSLTRTLLPLYDNECQTRAACTWSSQKFSLPQPQATPPVQQRLKVRRPVAWRTTLVPLLFPTMPPAGPTTVRTTTTLTTTTTLRDPCLSRATPCACATSDACAWADGACRLKQDGVSLGVPCGLCPLQVACRTPACVGVHSPCKCASNGNCRWDDVSYSCEARLEGAGTSCAACARQDQCSPPRLLGWVPESGAALGPSSAQVRLEFDRPVQRCGVAPGAAYIDCYGNARLAPTALDTVGPQNATVSITVPGNPEAVTSFCSLILEERAYCDAGGVPFLGLGPGGYTFRYTERVPPRVVELAPVQGQEGVASPVTLAIKFSENVTLSGSPAWARVVAFDPGADDPHDVSLSPPVARIVGQNTLTINVGHVLKGGVLYYLVLPAGAVVDLSGNAFAGFPAGVYRFKTALILQEPPASGVPVLAVALPVVAALAGGGLVAVAVLRHRKAKRLQAAQQDCEAKAEVSVGRGAGGGGRRLLGWGRTTQSTATSPDDFLGRRISTPSISSLAASWPHGDTYGGHDGADGDEPVSPDGLPAANLVRSISNSAMPIDYDWAADEMGITITGPPHVPCDASVQPWPDACQLPGSTHAANAQRLSTPPSPQPPSRPPATPSVQSQCTTPGRSESAPQRKRPNGNGRGRSTPPTLALADGEPAPAARGGESMGATQSGKQSDESVLILGPQRQLAW